MMLKLMVGRTARRRSQMLKVTVAVLAIVLGGTASAAGWRKLQIDASSEAAFIESVVTFREKLSPSRRVAFERSLRDIWLERTERATAEQREYTDAEYLRDLDGLGYEQVVTLVDPSGERAKGYRAAYYNSRPAGGGSASAPNWGTTSSPPPVQNGVYRGWTTQGGIRVGNNGCGC
jgi:hypothetical protein